MKIIIIVKMMVTRVKTQHRVIVRVDLTLKVHKNPSSLHSKIKVKSEEVYQIKIMLMVCQV